MYGIHKIYISLVSNNLRIYFSFVPKIVYFTAPYVVKIHFTLGMIIFIVNYFIHNVYIAIRHNFMKK